MSISKFLQMNSTLNIPGDTSVYLVDDQDYSENSIQQQWPLITIARDEKDDEACLIFRPIHVEVTYTWSRFITELSEIVSASEELALVAGFEVASPERDGGYIPIDFPVVACGVERTKNRVYVCVQRLRDLPKTMEDLVTISNQSRDRKGATG